MLTQAMLSGASPEDVWWDRVYFWWVDFLAAGLLMMLAVYAWRKSQGSARSENARLGRKVTWRVILFPVGFIVLTACLYLADLAWYRANFEGIDDAKNVDRARVHALN